MRLSDALSKLSLSRSRSSQTNPDADDASFMQSHSATSSPMIGRTRRMGSFADTSSLHRSATDQALNMLSPRSVHFAPEPAASTAGKAVADPALKKLHDELLQLPTFNALAGQKMDRDILWTSRHDSNFDTKLIQRSSGRVEVRILHDMQKGLRSSECRRIISATLEAYTRADLRKPQETDAAPPPAPDALLDALPANSRQTAGIEKLRQQTTAVMTQIGKAVREQEVSILTESILQEAAGANLIKPADTKLSWKETMDAERNMQKRLAHWEPRDSCFRPDSD